jgi:hypothetical protein
MIVRGLYATTNESLQRHKASRRRDPSNYSQDVQFSACEYLLSQTKDLVSLPMKTCEELPHD